MKIKGGKCAVYQFKGHKKYIYGAYQTIFLVWLLRTFYKLDRDRNPFDIYHMADGNTMYMELDICMPIQ